MPRDLSDLPKNERYIIASDPTTPSYYLQLLTKDQDDGVRRCVADNSNTPVEFLIILSTDPAFYVRQAVAKNKNTPSKSLTELANDHDSSVVWAVAGNPSTPAKTLIQLATHWDYHVKVAVAQNCHTPSSVLKTLAKNQKPSTLACAVVQNKSTPTTLIQTVYQQAVLTDTLTEELAMAVVQSSLILSQTEYCALIASFGANLADCIYYAVKYLPNSTLANQLATYGFVPPFTKSTKTAFSVS